MIIYADELFFKNFIMTYLVLIIVGEILSKKYRKKDVINVSILISFITVIAVFFDFNNNFIIRVSSILLMCAMGFKPKNVKEAIVDCLFILMITFLIGGVVSSNINNSFELIFCGVFSIMAFKIYNDHYKKKKWKIRNRYKIELEIENKKIELNAFLDTGNFLKSSVKGEPVIIISKESIIDKISEKIMKLLLIGEISELDVNMVKNIRTINYEVLNEKSKMSYGLKVENIKVKNDNCELIRDAIIILSEYKINESDAIIGINLLEGGFENGDITDVKAESKEIVC